MNAFGAALNAFRQVILMQARTDQLEKRIDGMAADVDGLTDEMANIRDRVARVEGVIEGAAMVARQRRIED